jgi:hypothetical protein
MGADLLIIECKQYWKSSTKNFSDALSDYADATPDTHVVLVNYGPVGEPVLASIRHEVAQYCNAKGHVRPQGSGISEFEQIISEVGMGAFDALREPVWHQGVYFIELVWREPVDLDLHIMSDHGRCGFDTPNGLAEAIFGGDDRGDGPGPFGEMIRIQPVKSERFDIIVMAFKGAVEISVAASAEVRIGWNTPTGRATRYSSLTVANARQWHVATLIRGQDEPEFVERGTSIVKTQ